MEYFSVLVSWGLNTYILNIVLANFIDNTLHSYVVSFLIIAFSASFFLTYPGTILLRAQNTLLVPPREEWDRVDAIFYAVYEMAMENDSSLPTDADWFIVNGDQPNAVAVGRHSIAVTTGLLERCDDGEIAALFAREFGHIAHGDAICSVLMAEGNFVVILSKACLTLALRLILGSPGYLFPSTKWRNFFFNIASLIGRFSAWITSLYLTLIYSLAAIPSYAAYRKREYAADQYSAELGFYDPLVSFLSKYPAPKTGIKRSLLQMFYGTHPSNESRIEHLKLFAAVNNILH